MGNTSERLISGFDLVSGVLAGNLMLETLKTSLLTQTPFQKMFGANGERIFINEVPAYNETILPLWEFQWDTETVQGSDLRQIGFVNSRVLFPNNLNGKFGIYRKLALVIARYFDSQFCVDDFVRKVPGLTEFGEDIEFKYNQIFNYGEMTVPALTMRFPFTIDLRRLRIEEECTDFDGKLQAELIEELETYIVEIQDDKGTVLIEEQPLNVEE